MNKKGKIGIGILIMCFVVIIGLASVGSGLTGEEISETNNKQNGYIYTENSKTNCSGGQCSTTLGERYIQEDGEWKNIWDAFSLKNSSIKCNVVSDGITNVTCLDWNMYAVRLSSIEILNDKSLSDSIPIKVVSDDGDTTIRTIEKSTVDEKEIGWVYFNNGETIHIGENSTTVNITGIDEDGEINLLFDRITNANPITLHFGSAGDNTAGYFQYDTTSIPDTATIDDTIFHVRMRSEGFPLRTVEFNPIPNKPTTSSDSTLWTDATGGTAYTTQASVSDSSTWYSKDLGTTADSDLEGLLGSDWFAVGMYFPGAGGIEVFINPSESAFDPVLEVTYTPAVDPVLINITSPINNTVYTTNNITLNVTTSGATIDTWWYLNSTSNTNVTFTPNVTLTYPEGLHNITVYANSSVGDANQTETIFFEIDAIFNCTYIGTGNWTVNDYCLYSDVNIDINGSLLILDGGTMNFTGTNTNLNFTKSGEWIGIENVASDIKLFGNFTIGAPS